jgi:hypothetical protein
MNICAMLGRDSTTTNEFCFSPFPHFNLCKAYPAHLQSVSQPLFETRIRATYGKVERSAQVHLPDCCPQGGLYCLGCTPDIPYTNSKLSPVLTLSYIMSTPASSRWIDCNLLCTYVEARSFLTNHMSSQPNIC